MKHPKQHSKSIRRESAAQQPGARELTEGTSHAGAYLGRRAECIRAASFSEATTRQIAEAASVSLPTLQYYFEDKEGLYRACAETILERYRGHVGTAGAAAREALQRSCLPEEARLQLKALTAALGRFLFASAEVGRWARFVTRELRDPGPAFEILYTGLWRPGVEVTARLVARVMSLPDDDPRARIRHCCSSRA